MMLTEDDVVRILKLVEQSTFDELHLETGEVKLVVRKKGCGRAIVESGSIATEPVAPSSAPARSAEISAMEPDRRKGRKTKAFTEKAGLVPIKAPLLGTVYRRPSPEVPPYVDVGSFVKEDETVCLIEVMKVFTAVKAGIRGRIAEALVETGEMVEYGQPLFRVEPGAGPA
jgi:acetyl-CoA carboxylase biotin carboxyl carrier protein